MLIFGKGGHGGGGRVNLYWRGLVVPQLDGAGQEIKLSKGGATVKSEMSQEPQRCHCRA